VSPSGTFGWTDLESNTGSTITSYSDSPLRPNTVRHYRVSPLNATGAGAVSDVVNATTESDDIITVPDAPTGLTATATGTTRISLSWIAPLADGGAEITGYRIEGSFDGISGWMDIESNTRSAVTSYDHTNLPPNTTHYYRVSAINSEGASVSSPIRNATTNAVVSFSTTIENQFYPVGIVLSEWSLPAPNGGVMPYDYTLTPTLPKGLTLNESTRTISGTPSNITPETLYTWAVEDSTGMVASLKFNLEVYALSFSESIDDQSYSRGQAIPPLILPEVTGGRTPI